MTLGLLVLELQLPQNVCLTHTDIFQKLSNRVQNVPKHINPLKPFFFLFYFHLTFIEGIKNSMSVPHINRINVFLYYKHLKLKFCGIR